MCTRTELSRRAAGDPVEELAVVLGAKRELLLRVHRHRLSREELEDCYGQATVELIASVQRGVRFASPLHIARVAELRFLARVHDRRRALSGRSPMQAALGEAASLDDVCLTSREPADPRARTEDLVLARAELSQLLEVARSLTRDQREVIASQVALGQSCREFCKRTGWSEEKYRKVDQRARARLRALSALSMVQLSREPARGRNKPARPIRER